MSASLSGRYRAVFRAAWAQRAALAGPRRLADEAAFLPAALSLQDTPVHPAPRLLAYAIMALFILALAWALLASVDIVAVAPGRIVVGERTKLVQPLERSVVTRVLVQDGDHVRAGQALIELDATLAGADRASAQEQFRAMTSELLRAQSLQAALQPVQPQAGEGPAPAPGISARFPDAWSASDSATAAAQLQAEWNDVRARLDKFVAELGRRNAEAATAGELVTKLESTLPMARTRERDFQRLVDQGYVSSHATQDKTRERVELERDLATAQARLAEARAAGRETENARSAYLAELRRNLHERQAQAELRRQHAVQEQVKAAQRERLNTLLAPVSGVVQQLAVHTSGGVVTEAQVLLVVVPDGAEVTAEVALENKDIGFVHAGQSAEVKLETFPYTRYGTVAAIVSRVSADAVMDEKRGAVFPATLALQARHLDIDGKAIRLAPGMSLSAEIKTGQRRVIDFVLAPVQRARSESLRER